MRITNSANSNNALIQLVFFNATLLIVFSCSQDRQVHPATTKTSNNLIAPQVTRLDNLPDSSKPGVTFLKSAAKPKTTFVANPPIVHTFINPVTKVPIAVEAQGMGFFTNFTTEDGLALDGIYCSVLDKRGNFWFGTNGGGVSRYDGKSFTNFTTMHGLGNNNVWSIALDKKGDIWFGTIGGGVSRYDGKTFTTYSIAQGLANNEVYAICEDKKGNLWFGTFGGGVSRYDGKKFTTYTVADGLAQNEVVSILEDKHGNLWFGTWGGGVSRYDGKQFTNFTTVQGLANNKVVSIVEDSKANLWFGTYEGGVSRFDGKFFSNLTTKQGLANNSIWSIVEDKNRNLWFGTGGGVSRFSGKSFTNFGTGQGLAAANVHSITEDAEGNFWFGTLGGGLSRYEGESFINYTTAQGLTDNNVSCIQEDRNGNLWFGTQGGGVICYNGKDFINYATTQGLAENVVWSMMIDRVGGLWFGTSGSGVSHYDGKSLTNYTTGQGLASNSIICIFEDKSGNLWFGSLGEGGVSRFDGKSFTNFTTKQGLANSFIWSIAEDKKGNLWFGTHGGGVSRFDGKSFTNYTTKQGLSNNTVMGITEDKAGNLWIGTDGGGVSRYDGKSFMSFTNVHGLPDNVVGNIIADSASHIFFGTNHGVGVLVAFIEDSSRGEPANIIPAQNSLSNEAMKSYHPKMKIYNSSTGYPVKDVNTTQKAMFRDSKGIIWMGTGSGKTGLVRFDYASVRKNNDPPDVRIRSIQINHENISWYNLLSANSNTLAAQNVEEATTTDRILSESHRNVIRNRFKAIQFDSITSFYPIPLGLVLPYHHNSITFDFTAIETSRPQAVKYQYILEGYDREWNSSTHITSATFGNIHEGTYTFKVKAQRMDGIWSEPIEYTFKVLPPWSRTWWFRTLIGIIFLFLLYGTYRWRTASLHKQKRILEHTVKERTVEVVKEKGEVEKRNIVIQKEKEKSDGLLLNILPAEVADELKEKGYTTAKSFDEVTVLFSDIKGFSTIAENMTAQELVKEIDTYFSAFDEIIQKYGLEKIKTIGDAYIAAGGLPEKNAATAQNVIEAAIAMQQAVEKLKNERIASNKPYFELRIGIHTGPVVAGVVGIKKFQYDIWGDTVNLAARMEQSGVPGKINISQHTYELVKEQFNCVHRGKIEAKNKGDIDMYFVE